MGRLSDTFWMPVHKVKDAGDATPEVRQEDLDVCVVRMEKHINER